jgi:hypothetical protein
VPESRPSPIPDIPRAAFGAHGEARLPAMTGRSTLKKRCAFERLLSGFILKIGMLAPLAGVGGIAVTQYFPCRESAFSYRAAVSKKSIAG